ncbi:hypothetical protein IEQ34_014642 [Dendrobium chrysotoxum]|uniref:HMG box domain-containing protein n=1 Tax=Dendrobium chrysotoxum TaxID=161865 RepID=A0AAV7G3S0_DENCH|nr:hypothetical protein IEQ34_014642 [Dendrobium chrysotoxum]
MTICFVYALADRSLKSGAHTWADIVTRVYTVVRIRRDGWRFLDASFAETEEEGGGGDADNDEASKGWERFHEMDIHVGLIDMHDCGMDSKIKMNLEAQVVEKVTEVKKPEKKRAASSTQKDRMSKKEKKGRDSKKRKRPPTAFFLYMEDFRKEFKEANPDNKSVALVAKEGGVKWKSMTDEERKPYMDRAAELKAEYDKAENDAENEEVKEENDTGEKGVEKDNRESENEEE